MSLVAVVGGGINGAGIAWELAKRGHSVKLFEKNEFGSGTSSKSSKLIHGGLRYLEHGHLRLVRESLRERRWLLEHFPDLVKPIELLFPVYEGDRRAAVVIAMGLTLYDRMAGTTSLPRHRRLDRAQAARSRSRLPDRPLQRRIHGSPDANRRRRIVRGPAGPRRPQRRLVSPFA